MNGNIAKRPFYIEQGAYQFLKINLRPFLRRFKTNFFEI